MYIHVAIILSSADRDSFAVGWRGRKTERQQRTMKEEQAVVDEAG